MVVAVTSFFFTGPLVGSVLYYGFLSLATSMESTSAPFMLPLPWTDILVSRALPQVARGFVSFVGFGTVSILGLLTPTPAKSGGAKYPDSLRQYPTLDVPSVLILYGIPGLVFDPPRVSMVSTASSNSSSVVKLPPRTEVAFTASFAIAWFIVLYAAKTFFLA